MAAVDSKAQIVREICAAGSMFTSCNHRRRSPRRLIFVDWYLVLRVNEDEKIDVIRKRYLHLALQLHPDKNKYPKANVAFNLVSEAYACLSDKAKRRAFSSERRNNFCRECYSEFQVTICHGTTHKQKPCKPTGHGKPLKPLDPQLRGLRKIFIEECEVIQSCLRENQACRQQEGSPLFNACDQMMTGYPHLRHVFNKKPLSPWHFNTSHVQDHCGRRVGELESPVYEIRANNYQTSTENFCFRA